MCRSLTYQSLFLNISSLKTLEIAQFFKKSHLILGNVMGIRLLLPSGHQFCSLAKPNYYLIICKLLLLFFVQVVSCFINFFFFFFSFPTSVSFFFFLSNLHWPELRYGIEEVWCQQAILLSFPIMDGKLSGTQR